MPHAPIPSVPQMLLRVASLINGDATLPLRVPVPTINFLRRLGDQSDHSTKPLGMFLLPIPVRRLVDEIIRIALPTRHQELRAELERLQIAKEDAVAHQEWQRAVNFLDQTDSLKDQLRQLGQDDPIEIKPDHILQAIANLGFSEAIDVNG